MQQAQPMHGDQRDASTIAAIQAEKSGEDDLGRTFRSRRYEAWREGFKSNGNCSISMHRTPARVGWRRHRPDAARDASAALSVRYLGAFR